MNINKRLTREASVLGGYKPGNDFTFRIDHIGLMLLPLALWYEPMSAWYDVVDLFLATLIFVFVMITYALSMMLLWLSVQPIHVLQITFDAEITDKKPDPKYVPMDNWIQKPTDAFTMLVTFAGWAIATDELPSLQIILTVAFVLFPIIGLILKKRSPEFREAAMKEAEDNNPETPPTA